MTAREFIELAVKETGLTVEELGRRLDYKSLRRAMSGEIPLPDAKRNHIQDLVLLAKANPNLVTPPIPISHPIDTTPYEIKTIYSGEAPRGRLIKVASWAQAGQVTDYDEIPADWQDEVATDCRDPDAIAVEIRGDSMLPIYQERDIVVLMPRQEPRTGCLVVARLRNEGVCFKIYSEMLRGIIRLSSYNEAYPPFERKRDDFQWICPVFEARRNLWP